MNYKHTFVVLLLCLGASPSVKAASTAVDWENVQDRRWPGSAFWANRLQDWSVNGRRLQCAYEFGGSDDAGTPHYRWM